MLILIYFVYFISMAETGTKKFLIFNEKQTFFI